MTPQDMDVLESKVQAALWYPLQSFGRMTKLLLEYEGRGDVEYLRERGRRAAERIVATGIYDQLSANLMETYGERVGRVMVTLGPSMYRDTEWTYEVVLDPQGRERIGFRVGLTCPVEFPALCRHATLGFIEFLTERTLDVPYSFTSAQPAPNRVDFEGRRK